jgi:hypothetical protein
MLIAVFLSNAAFRKANVQLGSTLRIFELPFGVFELSN